MLRELTVAPSTSSGSGSCSTSGDAAGGRTWPSRLLGLAPWTLAGAVALAAVATLTPALAWTAAGLVAGLSLSGSI